MPGSASVALADDGIPFCHIPRRHHALALGRLKWQLKGVPEVQHPLSLSHHFTFPRGDEQGECNRHGRSAGILSPGNVVLSGCLISRQHLAGTARVIK